MHRVHLGLLPTRPRPVIYMYVVGAKIPCLPSKLSSTHSYCQHGHDDISETRGVADRDRSSCFPHASSASGAPFNSTKPGHLYVRCECKNTLLLLLLLRGFFAIRVVLPTRVGSYSYAHSLYGCHLMKKSIIKVRVPVAPSRSVVEKKGRMCPKPKKQILKHCHRPFRYLYCRRPWCLSKCRQTWARAGVHYAERKRQRTLPAISTVAVAAGSFAARCALSLAPLL